MDIKGLEIGGRSIKSDQVEFIGIGPLNRRSGVSIVI